MMGLVNTIEDMFRSRHDVAAVILFGSQAQGTQRSNSDIDLAVLFRHETIPDTLQLLDLKSNLEESLGSKVDLLCLNNSSPIIGLQVYKHGQTVIVPDQKTYDYYLMRLFTDYHDLKYLRKEAENAILERKFYG